MDSRICPRCAGRLFKIATEFGFYLDQCIVCGFEDYDGIRRQSKIRLDAVAPRLGNKRIKRHDKAA